MGLMEEMQQAMREDKPHGPTGLETLMEPRRSLARKMTEIVAAVARVPKAGHNDHFNYDFAQESDVLAAVRLEMAKRQVHLWPSVRACDVREVQGKNGGALYVTVLIVDFTWEDGESGEKRVTTFVGEGEDSHDKGANKAITAAEKYCLLKTLLLPTGADPDGDAPAEEVPRQGGQSRPTQTPPPQERRAPAPARQPTPASGPLPDSFPNFGSQKGRPLLTAQEKDLKWYAKVLRENVADPAKARFKDENAAYLKAIERALESGNRRGPTDALEEPPPPGDDDAPF